jgi:hypothetical protein
VTDRPVQPGPSEPDTEPTPIDSPAAGPPSGIPTYWLSAGGPPAERPRRRFGRLARLAGIGVALLAVIGIKVLAGMVAGSVATTAFGAVFGGPWEHLPADVRSDYDKRLETAIGPQIKGLSDADAATRVQDIIRRGLSRLDNQSLVRHLTLEIAALDATDQPTCASFGRASISGRTPDPQVGQRLVAALDAARYQEYVGVNIAGAEAEARQSPPVQPVDPSGQAVLGRLLSRLSATQLTTLQAMAASSGATASGASSDADACGVIRSIYDAVLRLDAADLAIIARVDVTP